MVYQRTPYVESKRAEARDRSLQAALALLGEGGWRSVQMSAVAAHAGLSTGALYLHFPSKTQLLIELYRAQAGKELAVTAEIAARKGSAAERLASAIRAFTERAISGGRLGYAMILEPTDTEVEEVRLAFHAQFIAQFRQLLDEGCKAGEMHIANTQVAAACVFGSITESLMHPLGLAAQDRTDRRRGKRTDTTSLVDSLIEFCLRGVIAAPKPKGRR